MLFKDDDVGRDGDDNIMVVPFFCYKKEILWTAHVANPTVINIHKLTCSLSLFANTSKNK